MKIYARTKQSATFLLTSLPPTHAYKQPNTRKTGMCWWWKNIGLEKEDHVNGQADAL